ncbi:MAG: TolC family protein [Flavobacteriales bacterium]|nr:TolC family protein [Flavobacteriales bacterium]
MKKLLLFFLFLISAVSFKSQASFSLEDALSYALLNNIEYKNSRLDLNIAEQKVKESVSTGLPKITSSVGFQNYINLPTTVIPSNAFNPLAPADEFEELQFGTSINTTGTLKIDQLIFSATYVAGLKAAKVYKELTAKVTEKSLQDTKEKVVGAYYAYLILEENKTLLNNSLINLNAIQKETEILVSEGLFEQINLDQINYSVLKLNNQISQIDHQATNSINILKFVIGFPQDSSLTLSNSLTDFNAENVSLDQFQISPSQMLDYQIVDENRKLSLLTLKMNKVSAIPSISGFFSHQQTALRNEFNLLSADKPWYPSTFWGININIPIFTSGESLAVTKQSELAFKKSENLLLSVEQGLKQQLSQLYTEYNLALYALENDKENLILSQKILSNTLTRFKEGLKSGLEVAQAQNQEISAQNQLLQSHFNLLLAKLKLDKLMNKL